jgi:hypothetical protein
MSGPTGTDVSITHGTFAAGNVSAKERAALTLAPSRPRRPESLPAHM